MEYLWNTRNEARSSPLLIESSECAVSLQLGHPHLLIGMWIIPKATGSHPWPLWSTLKETGWFILTRNNAGLIVDKPYRIILKTYVHVPISQFTWVIPDT